MGSILLFVDQQYEDLEFWYPKIRMEEAGYQTVTAGSEKGATYLSKHGYPAQTDLSYSEALDSEYSAVIIPGGFAPDRIRKNSDALSVLKKMHEQKKPIAFICHAGWVPISAKILKNKKVTGVRAIRDDLENAGATFIDEAVVVDENLISSRTPKDLPQFCSAILKQLEK